MIKNLTLRLMLVLALLSAVTAASAQDAEMSSRKLGLINELRDMLGITKIGVQQKADNPNIDKPLLDIVNREKDLTDEERTELKAYVADLNKVFVARMSGALTNEEATKKTLESAFAKYVDKNLTEEELEELVAFSRTAAGKKAVGFLQRFDKGFTKSLIDEISERIRLTFSDSFNDAVKALQQRIKELKAKRIQA